MRRILIGWLLVGHALAYAAIGLWAEREHMPVLIAALWGVAIMGFLAAGFGVLRVPPTPCQTIPSRRRNRIAARNHRHAPSQSAPDRASCLQSPRAG